MDPEPPPLTVDWTSLWQAVADRVAAHGEAGRRHVLTEDVVRFESVLAMGGLGVPAGRLAFEVAAPVLAGGKIDLVVDGLTGAVIEFKFPRGSRTASSPDTMTLGELLRDFLRVAVIDARDRWVVQLLDDRLTRYLVNASTRYGLRWAGQPGDVLELTASAIGLLPPTATTAIGRAALSETVVATCAVAAPAGHSLTLYAYRVEGLSSAGVSTRGRAAEPTALSPAAPSGSEAIDRQGERARAAASGSRDGARSEILVAAKAVLARSGRLDFAVHEVMAEMAGRGTGYADQTIRTMITSHLCADATGPGSGPHDDFTRTGRGTYRFTR